MKFDDDLSTIHTTLKNNRLLTRIALALVLIDFLTGVWVRGLF